MELPAVRTNVYECVTFKVPHGWKKWYFLVSWRSGRTEMLEFRDDYSTAVKLVEDKLREETSDEDQIEEILLAPSGNWTN
jgi:hypothetical protein